MKFSLVRTDKNNALHLSVKTDKWFIERIQSDTKSGDIGQLRTHIIYYGDDGAFERTRPIAMVYPAAELAKTKNGNLEVRRFNNLVTLHVPQLLRPEDIDAVKDAAKMLPMTLAAFVGADGRSVEILVAVTKYSGGTLELESQMDAFSQAAYDSVFSVYSGFVPKPIERQKSTVRSCFRMTLDPTPYYNSDPNPMIIDDRFVRVLLPASVGPSAEEEQRETDLRLYADYEMLYRQAFEETYDENADLTEDGYFEAFLTHLAQRLCQKGVPQEEAVLHIHNHHQHRDGYNQEVLRAIVDAAYAESRPRRQRKGEMVSSETHRLIRFLTTRYVFRRNTVLGYAEYRPNHTGMQDWQPCDETAINGLSIEARLANIDVRDKDVRRYVHSNMIRTCDPIADYLAKVANRWDGKTDHIAELARCVPCDIPQWETWFKKWFVAMVAQWLLPDQEYGNSVVPLLISPQGDGKTTFCRMLLPRELSWGFLENLDVSEKRQTLQAMHNFLLINLDEFNQISPKLQEGFLKNVIQLPSVKIKRPYGKHVEEFRRYASFIATTNEVSVLNDPTGSRRFICVNLTAPVRTDYRPNYDALYGQACHIVKHRTMKWWFTADEVQQVMAHNAEYVVLPPAVQYFLDHYEPAVDTTDGQWLSPTAIYHNLCQIPGNNLTPNGESHLGRYLLHMPELQNRRVGRSRQYLVRRKP